MIKTEDGIKKGKPIKALQAIENKTKIEVEKTAETQMTPSRALDKRMMPSEVRNNLKKMMFKTVITVSGIIKL